MPGLALVLMLTAAADEAVVQQTSPSGADVPAVVIEDVEVLGRRGRALLDPEVELDGAAIDALGVYDIGEVIRRMTDDYGLGDAPMIVVNGRRMADPGVFSGFPPDALVRFEILPAGAGAVYGATDPSRRVVNIVLQRRFHSRDGRASLRRPTAGGLTNAAVDLRQSSILDARTRQFGVQATVDTALRVDERNLDRGNAPGAGAVTLRSPAESVAANLTQTGEIGDWAVSLNASARAGETRAVSLSNGEPVESRRRSRGLTTTAGLNGDVAGWSVQAALTGGLSWNDQSGLSPSDTRRQAVSASLGGARTLVDLPAGPMSVSLSARASRSHSTSERPMDSRSATSLTRDLNADVSIPLLRRSPEDKGLAEAPGDLSLTFGLGISETGAGRGDGLNTSLSWAPLSKLRLNASWSTATQSLADSQRYDPEYYGEPILVFDFLKGEAVEVLPRLGGNPDLRQPADERLSLSASAGPFTAWALQGGVNYQRSEAIDGIGVLPDPTPEVEAAFPERFQRDAEGRLTGIDQRPINLASVVTEGLTTNIGAVFRLGATGAGRRPGLLRVTVNHTWQLTNATTVSDRLARLDRLVGDGGGVPVHQIGLGVDMRQGRWGVNATARWRSGYRSRRDIGRDGPDDLRTGALSAMDLRLSYQFERNIPARGQGGGRRGVGLLAELEIANLFDARPGARFADGRTVPGYGRDDRDPVGRTVLLSLKRRF